MCSYKQVTSRLWKVGKYSCIPILPSQKGDYVVFKYYYVGFLLILFITTPILCCKRCHNSFKILLNDICSQNRRSQGFKKQSSPPL